MRRLLSVVAALSAANFLTVLAQVNEACVADCSATARANFVTFGCTSADDSACLCGNDNFEFSVRDCATAGCSATPGDVQNLLAQSFCQGVISPSGSSAAESTVAATTAAPAATTSSGPVTTSVAPAATTPSETALSSKAHPKTNSQHGAATHKTADASGTSASPSGTALAGGAAGSKEDDHGSDGLSQAATIGIAVGVSLVGIAAIAAALCLFMRRRKRKVPQFEISKPMPHIESPYGPPISRRDRYAEKRMDDIEMTTNRYEDMVPAQEPRTIV